MSKRLLALPVAVVMAYLLSGCHVLRNVYDVAVTPDGNGDVFSFVLRDTDFFNDVSTTNDAWDTIYSDLDANCGPDGNDADGDWGTPGDSMDPPDSALIDCAADHIALDPEEEDDPASLVCYDTDHNCQDTEDPPNYTVYQDATDFYRSAVAEDPAQFVTAIRDWQVQGESKCLGYTVSAPNWTFYSICPA